MHDVTEPDESGLEEYQAAVMLADALASLAMLADAGASLPVLRRAITAAIADLPEAAVSLVNVALEFGDPPALAVTSRRPEPRRERGHLGVSVRLLSPGTRNCVEPV